MHIQGGGVGLARFRKVQSNEKVQSYLCEVECSRSLTVVKRYCGGWRVGGVAMRQKRHMAWA